MATAKAVTKYLRISPKKAALAAALIRGKSVNEAILQLKYSNMKAGKMLEKTLDSAVANAETQHDLRRDNMRVIEVRIDGGPRYKRSRPKNKGGSHPILRRTSHFTIVVGE